MNRIIKFRVWDDKLKVLYTPEKDAKYLNLWQIPAAKGGNVLYPNGVLMQCTGLHDKNAKEIYEGDVVAIPLYGNAIIIWNENICAFQYAYSAIGEGTSVGGRMTNTLYDHYSEVKYEVIGNVYENPDLLIQNKPQLT